MSEIFVFYKLAITSGCNMFYLHLLIELVSPNKYWRVLKSFLSILKGAIQG